MKGDEPREKAADQAGSKSKRLHAEPTMTKSPKRVIAKSPTRTIEVKGPKTKPRSATMVSRRKGDKVNVFAGDVTRTDRSNPAKSRRSLSHGTPTRAVGSISRKGSTVGRRSSVLVRSTESLKQNKSLASTPSRVLSKRPSLKKKKSIAKTSASPAPKKPKQPGLVRKPSLKRRLSRKVSLIRTDSKVGKKGLKTRGSKVLNSPPSGKHENLRDYLLNKWELNIAAWRVFDRNNDGQLTREEFDWGLKQTNLDWISKKSRDALFRGADTDGSGTISYKEFKNEFKQWLEHVAKTHVDAAPEELVNKGGQVAPSEAEKNADENADEKADAIRAKSPPATLPIPEKVMPSSPEKCAIGTQTLESVEEVKKSDTQTQTELESRISTATQTAPENKTCTVEKAVDCVPSTSDTATQYDSKARGMVDVGIEARPSLADNESQTTLTGEVQESEGPEAEERKNLEAKISKLKKELEETKDQRDQVFSTVSTYKTALNKMQTTHHHRCLEFEETIEGLNKDIAHLRTEKQAIIDESKKITEKCREFSNISVQTIPEPITSVVDPYLAIGSSGESSVISKGQNKRRGSLTKKKELPLSESKKDSQPAPKHSRDGSGEDNGDIDFRTTIVARGLEIQVKGDPDLCSRTDSRPSPPAEKHGQSAIPPEDSTEEVEGSTLQLQFNGFRESSMSEAEDPRDEVEQDEALDGGESPVELAPESDADEENQTDQKEAYWPLKHAQQEKKPLSSTPLVDNMWSSKYKLRSLLRKIACICAVFLLAVLLIAMVLIKVHQPLSPQQQQTLEKILISVEPEMIFLGYAIVGLCTCVVVAVVPS